MISLVFISESRIDPLDRAPVLDAIEAVSIARNSMLDITGLLIVAPGHFVQLCEGPAASIATVMSSIMADPRHAGVRIVCEATLTKPRCPRWRMVRFVSETFGNVTIAPLLTSAYIDEDADSLRRIERLISAVDQRAASR